MSMTTLAVAALAAHLAAAPLGTPAVVAGPITITNAPKGARLTANEAAEQARRETAYRAWYRSKNGSDPDDAHVRAWYERAYGLSPS
jgi:hypothetical protein